MTDYRMHIAGEWVQSESGSTLEATSPATGETIGTVPEGTREDAQRAIAAATAAWRGWAALSAFERAHAMERVAELVAERRDDLAHTLTLDQGKPLSEARDEVGELEEYWRMAAADGTRLEGLMPPSVDAGKRVLVYRVPRGVVGIVTPWNWPYTMPAELLAPALAAGNAVVWSPAPSTSVCAVKLAECVVDAELPAGVFNLITGPGRVVGDEIVSNPGTNGIGFIGSTKTGYTIAERAAGKTLLLEMGGNGPLVVLDDADVDKAVEATVTASFLCAGQSCTAGELFLVHEAVHDEFLDKLATRIAEQVKLGDPFDEATTMGPLNNGGEDGRARQRRRRPRCGARGRGVAGLRISDEPLLRAHRSRPRQRGDGGGAGGDLRSDRPYPDDQRGRRGAGDDRRRGLRPPRRGLHA
jgi:acyl-CoA reductase-like NAD-dependent aldehyde dehydrogenase